MCLERAAARRRLRDLQLPEFIAGDVELALAEAVNNVTEHAYRGRTDGMITVSCRLEDERLIVNISDHGDPMPEGELPEAVEHDLETARHELPEGGFGWGIIYALASAVRYDRRAQRNTLSIIFDLPAPGEETAMESPAS